MAGDWIKWSKGLSTRREVVVLASRLNRDRHEIAGRLMVMWEWLDDNVSDAEIDEQTNNVSLYVGDKPFEFLDALLGLPGFADALASDEVRWLTARSAGRLTFPNFGRHNGTTAKTRALESRKKQRQRAKPAEPSRETSRDYRDNNGTREEERREENFSHTHGDGERRETPAEKRSKVLRDAIRTWNNYWRETHGSGRPDSDTRIDQMLATARSHGWSDEMIAESIRRSIGWNAKSWRDPGADHDLATKAKVNGARRNGSDADPRGTFAAAGAWLAKQNEEDGGHGDE
jgi:hypothetical protein